MKKISFEEAIKALEDGKMIVEKHTSHETANVWRDEKGVLWAEEQVSHKLYYNVCLDNDTSYYLPEEPKPFEITETGLYKTRSGDQAFVYYINKKAHPNHTCYYVVVGDPEDCHCHSNGLYKQGGEQGYDIIGKWGEE